MSQLQNFRSAFNGFNREDVVNYIAYINNHYNAQLNQLRSQLQSAEQELQALRAASAGDARLQEELGTAKAQISALEADNAALREQLEKALTEEKPQTQEELEAYRRAERAERMANERVAQLYAQANGALGEATVKVDEVSNQLSGITDQVIAQLTQLQSAVSSGKDILREASAAMYAVQPIPTEE